MILKLLFERLLSTNVITDPLELSPSRQIKVKLVNHSGLKFGLCLFLVILFVACFGPSFLDYSPYQQDLSKRLLPPIWVNGGSWDHIFGTDGNGRDYLARIVNGARISLIIGIGAAFVGMVIGVTLGVIAGYFGGLIDQAINFLLTCQLALPGILLAMSLIFLIGPSVTVVIFVIGGLHWTLFLVVARTSTKRIRAFDFVTAAKALGLNHRQIIIREILPNIANQIIVIFTLEVGVAILAEASLSFIGVGIQPPTPSWGLLIAEGKDAIFFQPWLIILPGIALFALVVSINMLGDGLRDITDPTSRFY